MKVKRHCLTGLVLLAVSMTASASEYAQVLRKAEMMEGALRSKQTVSLAEATTGHIKGVMDVCEERVGPMPGGLGVVFEINGDGQVTQTWTRNGSDYEQCFASVMKERIDYVPPIDPFYTAMDFGRSGDQ